MSEKKKIYGYAWGEDRGGAGCGMKTASGFSFVKQQWGSESDLAVWNFSSGCKYMICSFKDTPECARAYEVLSSRYPIAWQSEVRRNGYHPEKGHTGTFYVMFDTTKHKLAPKELPDDPFVVEHQFNGQGVI